MNWPRVMLLIVAFVLGLGTNAWAGAPTDQVRSYTDRVLKVLEAPALTQLDSGKILGLTISDASRRLRWLARGADVHHQAVWRCQCKEPHACTVLNA